MNALKSLCAATLFVAAFSVSFDGTGSNSAQAGYYSGWSYYPSRSYYYRSYYYKPYSSYRGYKYHYAIYYPSRPRYYYYYNPYKKAYWGRYDLEAKGYSELAEKDRKGTLAEIPEEAFPEPGAMPAIPESTDGSTIEVPPNDAPPNDSPEGVEGGEEAAPQDAVEESPAN